MLFILPYVSFNVVLSLYLLRAYELLVCQDSAVGIETGYGLDGPGIESRWVVRSKERVCGLSLAAGCGFEFLHG
jgi:hypothetical protein